MSEVDSLVFVRTKPAHIRPDEMSTGCSLTPAMPTPGTGVPTTVTTVSSLATPSAAIGRGLGRLTPGQVKVAELRRALAEDTAGQAGSTGNQPATRLHPTGGGVSPGSGLRIPGTPPASPTVPVSTWVKRPATVVPTLGSSLPVKPPTCQAASAVTAVLNATAAVNVSGATTSTASERGAAVRAPRSRAPSEHSVSNTTVVNMIAALQAQIAALRQLTAPLVTVQTESVLSQLDDGDISSVSEHRTRHRVADSTSQSYSFGMAGVATDVRAGSSLVQPVSTSLQGVPPLQSQVAVSSVAAGGPSLVGTRLVSVPKDTRSGASGVTFPAQTPTVPAVMLDSRPLVYSGESPVGPFLAQFRYTAELRGWPRETWGLQLLTSLEGRARSLLAVETFDRRPTFEEVEKKLRSNFGTDMSAVSYRHELELVRRGERETISSLGLRVKDLVMKAYPKLDAGMRQELAIAPFIRALNDPQLEQAIWATTPATLQRAMEVALACENGMRVVVGGRDSRSQGATVRIHRIEEGVSGEEMQDENGVDNLVASVRALSQQISKIESDLNKKFRSQADQTRSFHSVKAKKKTERGIVVCFYCQKRGHYATDCPEKQTACVFTRPGNGSGRRAAHQAPGLSEE
jgi:hypothetical protein